MIAPAQLGELYLAIDVLEDMESFYQRLLQGVRENLPFDCATLFLTDHQSAQTPRQVYSLGEHTVEFVSTSPLFPAAGVSGWILEGRTPVIINNRPRGATAAESSLNSLLFLPLLIVDRNIGVLNLASGNEGVYHKEERDHYAASAAQVSALLFTMQLRQQLEGRNRQAQKLLQRLHEQEQTATTAVPQATPETACRQDGEAARTEATRLRELLDVLPALIETRNQRKLKHSAAVLRKQARYLQELLQGEGQVLPSESG